MFLFILCIVVQYSCNFVTRKDALKFNNTIVAINDSLYLKGKEFGNLINTSFRTKDYSRLQYARLKFERFLDSGRKSINSLKNVGGSEALKSCEMELLGIENRMIEQDFKPFELLTPSATEIEVGALFETVKKDGQAEAEHMKKLNALQSAYASKNGFSLKENALALNTK